jgi:NADH:ubiquinone oxidoreductase subunit 5 (subunit L)/multisubunit Na+/H+ antiporter MnhA subunit
LYSIAPSIIIKLKYNLRSVYIFLNNKWHFDSIYNNYLVKPLLIWGHNVSYKTLDKGLIEYIGPHGLVIIIQRFSKWLSYLQSGYVYNYAFTIFLGTTVYLLILNSLDLLTYKTYNMEILVILLFYAYSSNISATIKNKE